MFMLFYYALIPCLVAFVTCSLFVLWWRSRIKKNLEIRKLIEQLKAEISELVIDLNGATERNIVLLENKLDLLNDALGKAAKMQKILIMEREKNESAERISASLSETRPLSIKVEAETPLTVEAPIPMETLSEKDKILVLYRRGESIVSIAEELGMSRGKVELVLSLHDR